MTNPEAHLKSITYHDFWLKIIGCLIASELIDALGRNGSILARINMRSFYVDLAAGFFIALLLWELVRYVIIKLDQRVDWFAKPIQRISLQILFAVAIPAFLSFVFTMFYMQIAYQQDIFQTTWLHSEFYVVILVIVMINLVYFNADQYYETKITVAPVVFTMQYTFNPAAKWQPYLEGGLGLSFFVVSYNNSATEVDDESIFNTNFTMMPAVGLKYKASENFYPFFETGLVSLMDGPPVGFPEGYNVTGYVYINVGAKYVFVK